MRLASTSRTPPNEHAAPYRDGGKSRSLHRPRGWHPENEGHMKVCGMKKVIIYLGPNEVLIPADQVPGAIADALYPAGERNEATGGWPTSEPGRATDPDAVKRLREEQEQLIKLRKQFPGLFARSRSATSCSGRSQKWPTF